MKKNILFVAHHLSHGGVQKSLIEVLNVLDYDKNDVTLYLRKARLDLLPYVNKNVKVIVNDDKTRYYRKPKAFFLQIAAGVASLLKNESLKSRCSDMLSDYIAEGQANYEKTRFFDNGEEYDIAIAYQNGIPAWFTEYAVRAKKKIVFHHAGYDEGRDISLKIFPEFDKIVAINEAVRSILLNGYPDQADKIAILENYVDYSAIGNKAKENADLSDKTGLRLCSCGRLSTVKGFDIAVDAAKKLKDRGFNFVWYFVGDGPERVKLEKQCRDLGVSENIVFTGMKDNPYPYIGSCDIYVQPSRSEAYPIVLLEAAVLCKPTVCTDTVGSRFIIEQNNCGLLSDINGDDLADKIITLHQDKDMTERFVQAEREINWKSKESDYRKAWKELLED